MSRLVTASIIASVDWFMNCPDSWKQRAYEGLRDSLSRAPWEPTMAIKKGIAFENDVYKILGNKEELESVRAKASDSFKFFLDECEGGRFQNKNKEYVDIDGEEYCLYVKEDAFFRKGDKRFPNGHIIDIKTSGKWGGRQKYLSTFQHKLYCLVEEIPTFDYIVAVWEDADGESRKIKSTHKIQYVVEDFDALREEVLKKVQQMVNFLQADEELWELYTTKFSRY